MVVHRREVWWADLGEPKGSGPGFRRPLLVVQAEAFNRSRIRTVLCVVLSSNVALLNAPGNVLVPAGSAGLSRDSVADVSQVVTLDRDYLIELTGSVSASIMGKVDEGLRLVLEL